MTELSLKGPYGYPDSVRLLCKGEGRHCGFEFPYSYSNGLNVSTHPAEEFVQNGRAVGMFRGGDMPTCPACGRWVSPLPFNFAPTLPSDPILDAEVIGD